MTSTMLPTQKVSTVVSPVKADGSPSTAKLSSVAFTSGDSTIFTVAADPSDASGATAIVTGVAAGSATLSATATATEPDGTTTETILGTVTIILAVPPPAPAAALTFTFGTPS